MSNRNLSGDEPAALRRTTCPIRADVDKAVRMPVGRI